MACKMDGIDPKGVNWKIVQIYEVEYIFSLSPFFRVLKPLSFVHVVQLNHPQIEAVDL